jgi:hypothetical protein
MTDKLRICFIQATNSNDVQWSPPVSFGYLKAHIEDSMPGKVEFRLARGVQEAIGFNPHILGISCFSQDFDDAVKICNQARASVPYIILSLAKEK